MGRDRNHEKTCQICGRIFYRDTRCTWAYWARAKFCSRKCSAVHWTAHSLKKTPTVEAAFWKKVEKTGDDDCWKWTGSTDKDGYPLLSFRRKQFRAARIAAIISCGSIKNDQQACHRCGNLWCCNPGHIYAGSPTENSADKVMHGTHKMGEDIHCAKLTAADVRAIRLADGSNSSIGKKFGVSASNICQIKNFKTWKHVK